jgi:hypothetical protein
LDRLEEAPPKVVLGVDQPGVVIAPIKQRADTEQRRLLDGQQRVDHLVEQPLVAVLQRDTADDSNVVVLYASEEE